MNIIYSTIELIVQNDFYGVDDELEKVKGKYKYKKTLKQKLEQIKRKFFLKIKQ